MTEPAVRYRIFPRHPGAHLFEVSCTVATPDPAGQIVSLPTWIPGSYMIREFARNIVWLKASCNGRPIPIEKIDKATWRCAPDSAGDSRGRAGAQASDISVSEIRDAGIGASAPDSAGDSRGRAGAQASDTSVGEIREAGGGASAPCADPLTLTCEVYAWDLSVRAAHLDETHGFFNGTCVFLMVHGQESAPVEVDIVPPDGERCRDWRVATSLPRAGAAPYGFGTYRAADYYDLVDHPVEMGTFALADFAARGVPHDIAITGRHRADMKRLSEDLQAICEYQIDFFGQGDKAPMDRYVFLIMAVGEGYGGLEHRASTALICSRDDLPNPQDKERGDKYRKFLGLASHEYFHTWNVKRIKPAAFIPYDLTRENYTRQLWAFEGITSYYDDLVLVRTGLITKEQYLSLIAETITRVLRGSGRLKQSIAESSFDAWIKYYRQDENAPNALVNYYAKGSLAALALDLTIRLETDGERSLDDVMRALWQRYGARGIGVPEGGVEQLAEEIVGTSLKDFFAHAVHGTNDLPLKELLAQFGVDLFLRTAENAADEGGKPAAKKDAPPRAVLGVKISANGEAKLAHVYDGGAAQVAGLSAGDVIVAIDGLRVNAGNLDTRIASYPVGAVAKMHAFRRDELMEFEVTLKAAPEDTCFLKLRETQDAAVIGRRESWLGRPGP